MIFRQFLGELRKLFSRKRTWMGFGVFLALELLIGGLFQIPSARETFRTLIESRGRSFDDYYSGLTLALLTMRTTTFFIGTLFLAMVAGEVVAKEVEDGSLRMLLCRPVSRFRVLAIKYVTVSLYAVVLVAFIHLAGLGIGLLYAGTGSFFAFGFQDHVSAFHPFHEGLIRYLGALPLLALGLVTMTSLGFMFSCFNMKPAAATVAALSLLFTDLTLRAIPFFGSLEGWFITARMGAWLGVFQPIVPWRSMAHDYILLLALDASCFVIGWLGFELRDLKV